MSLPSPAATAPPIQLGGAASSIMVAHEAERQRLSRYLQDDVSQYLLGMHVRLLVLEKEVSDCYASVSKEIAITERLVAQSMKIIRRLDRKGRA